MDDFDLETYFDKLLKDYPYDWDKIKAEAKKLLRESEFRSLKDKSILPMASGAFLRRLEFKLDTFFIDCDQILPEMKENDIVILVYFQKETPGDYLSYRFQFQSTRLFSSISSKSSVFFVPCQFDINQACFSDQ